MTRETLKAERALERYRSEVEIAAHKLRSEVYGMNEDESKECFREGCQGYKDGAKNPHPMGTSAARQWRLGWEVEATAAGTLAKIYSPICDLVDQRMRELGFLK